MLLVVLLVVVVVLVVALVVVVVVVVVIVGRVAKLEGLRAEVRGGVAVVGGVVRRVFVAGVRVWMITRVWREVRLVRLLVVVVVALFQIVGMGTRTRAGVGDGGVLVAVLGLIRGSSGWRVGAPHHRRGRRRGAVTLEGPRSGELVSGGAAQARIARVGRRRRAVVVRVRMCLRREVLWGLVVGVVLGVRVRRRRVMVMMMRRRGGGGRRGIAVCERVREHGLSTAR